MRRLLLVPVVAAALAGAVGCGGDSSSAAGDGQKLYLSKCAVCHGRTGGGGTGPAFDGGRLVEKYPDIADQIAVIANGRKAMPAFKSQLSPEEIRAIAEYERTL
ncbi:MAG: c-type cytochrome [Acidimicrobiales bacterium]